VYEEQPQKKVSKGLNVPTAILLAGALIAGSYYLANKSHEPASKDNTASVAQAQKVVLDPVTEQDHILGNPQAKIVLVEYSDLECPFCKEFHKTMLKIMNDYGKDGNVAWVYRHSPFDSLHPKARKEAEAAECANELGGNTAFWSFIDTIYEITPSNDGLDESQLSTTAAKIGLNKTSFDSCLASGKYANKVEAQYQSGQKMGISGTPSSFIVSKGNDTIPVEGAQPYTSIKGMLDTILSVTQTKEN
jgi:protein-disulfide isomerase